MTNKEFQKGRPNSVELAAKLLRRKYNISIVQPLPKELENAARRAGQELDAVIRKFKRRNNF